MNLRDQILAADDKRIEAVSIPEWGIDLYVRTTTGAHRDMIESTIADEYSEKKEHFRARFAVAVCCDADGRFLFTGEDVPVLTEKSGRALDRILEAGLRVNAMTADAVDELEKNSESGQNAASGSD